ncbi:MAG: hypothetical protein ABIH92_03970 [Nanoarchaeota archaeon]
MFRELLDQVRVEGHIDVGEEPLLRDTLPVIYNGEADSKSLGAVKYHNSGGRSILFERGGEVYRIKGVDPFGRLTERVANSEKNRIDNVSHADLIVKAQTAREGGALMFDRDKPFGPFFLEQAECEGNAFRALAKTYQHLGIQNPCEFLFHKDSGVEAQGRRTYQTAFRLPSLEADFRTHEWNSLLTERLDQCSPDEIAEKSRNISRLYGRFIYWTGVNTAILSASGLIPEATSFVPQNWVINRYKDGYGIFRVDHTSTKADDPRDAFQALTRDKDIAVRIANEFSVYASRVQAAADPAAFLRETERDRRFSQILFMREGNWLKEGVRLDETRLLAAHENVFGMGLTSVLNGLPIAPIPGEMFREALA